ncbi:MAG: hypothetical protein WC371_01970, partial [Parachlamydiales bacterium]
TISNTVDGANALTITAGAGAVFLTSTIGASTAISSLTASGANITIDSLGGLGAGVTGATALTASNNINFTGTSYIANAQTYTAGTYFNMLSGALTTVSSSGDAITFAGNGHVLLAADTDLTINSSNGKIMADEIFSVSGSLDTLTLDAGSGDIEVGTIGVVSDSQFALVSLTSADLTLNGDLYADSLTLLPTGTTYAGGDIYTTNSAISFPTAVELTDSNIFSSGSSTGGDITFASTLDGDSDNARSLTLIARTSDIAFNGLVGATHPLLALTVSSAKDVDTAAAMTVGSLTQSAGTGTTTFGDALNVTSLFGLSLTGANFVLGNAVTTANNGAITVNNSGALTLSGTIISSAGFTQSNASGTTAFSGSVTAGQAVSFAGIVNLAGSPTIDTSAPFGRDITFSKAVEGPGNLELTAGIGDILFSADVGGSTRLGDIVINSVFDISVQSVTASSINLVSSTDTATLNGTINTNGAGDAIIFVGKNFVRNGDLVTTNGGSVIVTNSGTITGSVANAATIAGSYTQNGTGPSSLIGTISAGGDIAFATSVTLFENSELTAGGNITFSDAVDGSKTLSMEAAGNITLSGAVGSSVPLDAMTIVSVTDLAAGAISAASFTQTSGSGTSTFSGFLNTTGSSGISLTGTNIVRAASFTAQNEGSITIDNSGTFTSTALGTITAGGSFLQTGSGAVSLARVISAGSGQISFSGAVTLAGTADLIAGGTGMAITFNSTLNGAQDLILNASNYGQILFVGNVGAVTALDSIDILKAGNMTLPASLKAVSFDLQQGSGMATLYAMSGAGGNMSFLEICSQEIRFGGVIDTDIAAFNACGSILNLADPVAINSTGTATFNALGGDVGSLSSPILVNTSGQILAGSTYLADFNGTSGDNTVNWLAANQPYIIIFNGVVIFDRTVPLPTPVLVIPYIVEAAPGFDSSFFTLANDFFFKTFFYGFGEYGLENERPKLWMRGIKRHRGLIRQIFSGASKPSGYGRN